MSDARKEKHYITLPFGARTEESFINNSPFFPGRHTYQLSTPGENGELFWLVVKNVSGLLYPRFTTEDTILREFGVFQEGGTTVLLKAPIRNFVVDVQLRGGRRASYTDIRKRFAFVIAWSHSTAARPPGYDEINEIYNITSRWGRPNPFTYTIVREDDVAHHIDCFVQAPDPQDDVGNPDAYSLETKLKLTADQPTIYGDIIEEELEGKFGIQYPLPLDEEDTPIYFLDDTVSNTIFYSKGTRASARTGFRIQIPLNLSGPATLFSIGILEVNTGQFAKFKHYNYGSGGWVVGPSGPNGDVLDFNTVNKTFIYRTDVIGPYGGAQISLDQQMSPQVSWDDFEMVPGFAYKFFLELDDGSGFPTTVTSTLTYRPRWAGI